MWFCCAQICGAREACGRGRGCAHGLYSVSASVFWSKYCADAENVQVKNAQAENARAETESHPHEVWMVYRGKGEFGKIKYVVSENAILNTTILKNTIINYGVFCDSVNYDDIFYVCVFGVQFQIRDNIWQFDINKAFGYNH